MCLNDVLHGSCSCHLDGPCSRCGASLVLPRAEALAPYRSVPVLRDGVAPVGCRCVPRQGPRPIPVMLRLRSWLVLDPCHPQVSDRAWSAPARGRGHLERHEDSPERRVIRHQVDRRLSRRVDGSGVGPGRDECSDPLGVGGVRHLRRQESDRPLPVLADRAPPPRVVVDDEAVQEAPRGRVERVGLSLRRLRRPPPRAGRPRRRARLLRRPREAQQRDGRNQDHQRQRPVTTRRCPAACICSPQISADSCGAITLLPSLPRAPTAAVCTARVRRPPSRCYRRPRRASASARRPRASPEPVAVMVTSDHRHAVMIPVGPAHSTPAAMSPVQP